MKQIIATITSIFVCSAAFSEPLESDLVDRMRKTVDDFSGNIVYEHPFITPEVSLRPFISSYVIENAGTVSMRFRVHYTGEKWLFVRNVMFNIDGQIVDLGVTDWKRDHANGIIWEWADFPATVRSRTILEQVANSEKTTIRFIGQQHYDDMEVSYGFKKILSDMFDVEKAVAARP